MSIFFDFDVGPRGRRFRRAVDADRNDIELFWNQEKTYKIFGDVDIGALIELSPLAICMINENKSVTGFMALCDYPKVPGVDPAHWEFWIRNLFHKFYLSRNTLFIHLMCCTKGVYDYFLEEALLSVFQNDSYLQQIIIVVPPHCPAGILNEFPAVRRRKVYAHHVNPSDCHHLLIASRQDFAPKMKIRRAVEEDNDDIVEILDNLCPTIKELYGKYYISELVGRHPDSGRKILVIESHERAAAVMCLCVDVDYGKLQSTYELRPFHGLKKATPLEKEQYKRSNQLLEEFGDPIMIGKWSPFSRISKIEKSSVDDEPAKDLTADRRMHTKVNFGSRASRQSFDVAYRRQYSDDFSELDNTSPSQLYHGSVTDLLDEDPFDYDIVNIDNDLLAVPSLLSLDVSLYRSSSRRGHEASIPSTTSTGYEKCIKGKRRTSSFKSVSLDKHDTTTYQGKPNAFVIELLGMRSDIDERHAFDLLEAAFELMADIEYCVIRMPCKEKSFPLLQHFCVVPLKPNICCDHALYVAHRNSVLGRIRVRKAELVDVPQIANLLYRMDGKETLWTIENCILNKKELVSYVFVCGLNLIGIAIMEPPEKVDFLRAKFNFDPYHNHKFHLKEQDFTCGFSTAKVILAYPAFEVHYRFFIREIMRLSGSQSLLWLTAYRNKWVAHKANAVASVMIPVLPRKFEMDFSYVPELKLISNLAKSIIAFSTWYIGKKFTTVPKLNVDCRIVIIGASRTTMAFLNEILFGQTSTYLTFTNVTLVSPNGLPYTRHSNVSAESMFLKQHSSSDKYLKSIPYTYYVNVVQGLMAEINKQEKYITLVSGSRYHYDMLFLLLGKQYQHPGYLRPVFERDRKVQLGLTPRYVRLDVPKQEEMNFQMEDTPYNVFIVNGMTDAQKALNYVKSLGMEESTDKIIVYGATIHVYCCINTLLEMKVPAENIILVDPFPPENNEKVRVPVFCNVYVDQTMAEVLRTLKITVYRSYYFKSWIMDQEDTVSHIEFISYFKQIRLPCSAFFYYGTRGVNTYAFFAAHKSGMAYDGGIVIDPQFRTKDSWIYAAGPVTKYARKYFAEDRQQKYFDSYEVGQKLGIQIRNQLDPMSPTKRYSDEGRAVRFSKTSNLDERTSQDDAESRASTSGEKMPEWKLPQFKKPLVMYCHLPGGLQYLEVRPPGKRLIHNYVQSLDHNGHVLETFKRGYFKLHLTTELIVDRITCLTPNNSYSIEIFKNLFGLSTCVLNNVYLRYTAKKLDDFYSFFNSPWAFFLYLDQTEELFAMTKELLPKGQSDGPTIKEALDHIGTKLSNPSFKTNTLGKIRNNFEKSPHVESITDYVLEWLSEHDILAPMYFQPSQQTEFTYDLSRHPAFKKRKRNLKKMLSMLY